ncbi:hypothetical protein LNQ03_07855 [Klebsiella pneumoniae subsp. pneumoniae]|nr:hypothetical protein [Klebsiella pneumoniae subsp. pneumoniae]
MPILETVLADIRALIVRMPAELQASVSALLLESEPMAAALARAFTYRGSSAATYRETVRAVLLSSALGADLDQIAGVRRDAC